MSQRMTCTTKRIRPISVSSSLSKPMTTKRNSRSLTLGLSNSKKTWTISLPSIARWNGYKLLKGREWQNIEAVTPHSTRTPPMRTSQLKRQCLRSRIELRIKAQQTKSINRALNGKRLRLSMWTSNTLSAEVSRRWWGHNSQHQALKCRWFREERRTKISSRSSKCWRGWRMTLHSSIRTAMNRSVCLVETISIWLGPTKYSSIELSTTLSRVLRETRIRLSLCSPTLSTQSHQTTESTRLSISEMRIGSSRLSQWSQLVTSSSSGRDRQAGRKNPTRLLDSMTRCLKREGRGIITAWVDSSSQDSRQVAERGWGSISQRRTLELSGQRRLHRALNRMNSGREWLTSSIRGTISILLASTRPPRALINKHLDRSSSELRGTRAWSSLVWDKLKKQTYQIPALR